MGAMHRWTALLVLSIAGLSMTELSMAARSTANAARPASPSSDTQETADRTLLTACHVMPKRLAGTVTEGDAHYRIEPAATVHDFGISKEGVKFSLAEDASEKLVVGPTHGQLLDRTSTKGWRYRVYVPRAGYVGSDRVVFEVDGRDALVDAELKFRVTFVLKVTAESNAQYLGPAGVALQRRYCPQAVSTQAPR